MVNRLLVSIGLLSVVGIIPVLAEDYNKFTMLAGGGVGVPLNPTATYAGVGGNFLTGAGYRFDEHNAVIGEFMWHGLPPSVDALRQAIGQGASSNLYSLTANYRFSGNFGHTFGYYLIGGGGWYYRHVSLTKTVVSQGTVCQPIYGWYGYSCGNGLVENTFTLVSTGTSSGGGNAGAGLTIRLSENGWKFFIESRYNYAASRLVSTQVAPVTFGLQYH
jgi:hypothetical protein